MVQSKSWLNIGHAGGARGQAGPDLVSWAWGGRAVGPHYYLAPQCLESNTTESPAEKMHNSKIASTNVSIDLIFQSFVR